ncbi:cupin domain-containing protein [Novosphingobium flavum]|uniref:Cupin domain-containing protein n=1 Tax=Novosphingobium flavum TaxID=1778672 RepID=A0A7X1KND0_9SPHN|nr:cupin domain-containing protein [Novosphingobium flavum]MBC2667230.1 cupin domain-containing protein [Novosphingobium flavum]
MARTPLIVQSGQAGEPLKVVGAEISILAANQATGGMGFTLQQGDEGTGPPPHSHPWDEAFFVLDGQVEFILDGAGTMLQPGALVHVPGGSPHAFRFGPGGGMMLEVTGPGSNAAQMFRDFDAEMPPDRMDIIKAVEIFDRHGVSLMG